MTKQEQVTILEESVKRLVALASNGAELSDLRLKAEQYIAETIFTIRSLD